MPPLSDLVEEFAVGPLRAKVPNVKHHEPRHREEQDSQDEPLYVVKSDGNYPGENRRSKALVYSRDGRHPIDNALNHLQVFDSAVFNFQHH